MRVRRASVLASLLVSFVAAGGFTVAALDSPVLQVDPASQTFEDGTLHDQEFEPGAQPSIREDGSLAWSTLLQWAGAIVFGLVFVAAFILFRVEVRREKDALRARRHREDYYKDLRKYNAQLKGPPEQNT